MHRILYRHQSMIRDNVARQNYAELALVPCLIPYWHRDESGRNNLDYMDQCHSQQDSTQDLIQETKLDSGFQLFPPIHKLPHRIGHSFVAVVQHGGASTEPIRHCKTETT